MKAGFIKKKITPPAGIDMTGFVGRHNPSEGIYDDLYVRVIYLENENQTVIISADVIGFDLFTTNDLQNAICQRTGIPAANVIISATHTHSGPATMYLQSCGRIDPNYLLWLKKVIVESTFESVYEAVSVNLFHSSVDVSGLTYNRHRVLEDGTVSLKMEDGQKVKNEGPVDDKLSVISFVNDKSDVIGCITHFTCHPVVLGRDNTNISGDYPGILSKMIEKELGDKSISLFINGACGNINPVFHNTVYQDAQKMAGRLKDAAMNLLNSKGEFISPGFRVSTMGVKLPLKPAPTKEQLEEEEQNWIKKAEGKDLSHLDRMIIHAMISWTTITKGLIDRKQTINEIPVFIQQLQFDNLILAAVPGEIFVEYALDLQSQSGRKLLVAGYTNGTAGYFPDGKAYEEGGYAVEESYKYYGLPSAFEPDAGELIFEAHLELANSSMPGKKGKKSKYKVDLNPNKYTNPKKYFGKKKDK